MIELQFINALIFGCIVGHYAKDTIGKIMIFTSYSAVILGQAILSFNK